MQLSSTLTWLIDTAAAAPGADRLLAELGTRLILDRVPLAGGALTLTVPDPLIARRTWLWRADTEVVIEALAFAPGGVAGGAPAAAPPGKARPSWLAALRAGPGPGEAVGATADGAGVRWVR